MIGISGLSVELGGRPVLDVAELAVAAGELVCVLGPNGAGKTTLLRAIAGLVPCAGRLAIAGRPASGLSAQERSRLIAYLPQGHAAHWPLSVRDTVAIGRMPHGGAPGRLRPTDEAAIGRALAAVDALHLADRAVTELSGGERARVMLARALAVEAPVLLADEPIAALDPAHQLAVMGHLRAVAQGGGAVMAALHDLTVAVRFATRLVVLSSGRIEADGPPGAVMTPELLSRVFRITAQRFEHEGADVLVPWLTDADLRR